MEKKEELIARIRDAAKHVSRGSGETEEQALQRLCISPQCGFASHADGNDMTDADVSFEALAALASIPLALRSLTDRPLRFRKTGQGQAQPLR